MTSLRQRPALAAFLLIAALYSTLAFIFMPVGVYWSADIGLRWLQANSPYHDFSIPYHGQSLDPDYQFVPFDPALYSIREGHLYSTQPRVMPMLIRPFATLWGMRGVLIVPLLAGLVCAMLVASLARQIAVPMALSVLLAGLATPLAVYSILVWEHGLAVALGLGAVTLGLGDGIRVRRLILSGVLAGLAAIVREEMMLFAIVLGGVVWLADVRAWRRALAWGGAFGAVLGTYEVASLIQAGTSIQTGAYQRVEPGVRQASYFIANGLDGLPNFIFDPAYGAWVWLLTLAVIAYSVAGYGWKGRAAQVIQALLLLFTGIGVWVGTLGLKITDGMHGFLGACPLLIFMLVPGVFELKTARQMGLLVAGFLGLSILALGLLTSLGPLQAGLEWGTRFGLILFPLGVPLAARGLAVLWQRAQASRWAVLHWIAALGVVGVSVAVQARGLWLMWLTSTWNAANQTMLLEYPEEQIVTNAVWLGGEFVSLYARKEIYWIESDEELREWLQIAQSHNVSTFATLLLTDKGEIDWAHAAPPGTQIVEIENQDRGGFVWIGRYEIVSK